MLRYTLLILGLLGLVFLGLWLGLTARKPVHTRVERITDLANKDDYTGALSVYESTPASLKQDLISELKLRLPLATESYWLFVGLRLGLADRRAFMETIRCGSDSTLLGCMRYCPEAGTDWRDAIEALSRRWGRGSWNYLYDAAAWLSMETEDFQKWGVQERKLLLNLLVRSLKQRQPPKESWSVYVVVAKAFDVKAVSGKTVYELCFGDGQAKSGSGKDLADWLVANRTELLRRQPPRPTTRSRPRAPWSACTRRQDPRELAALCLSDRNRVKGVLENRRINSVVFSLRV